MPPLGRLITVEGGEGAGKSTQLRRLAVILEASGQPCLLTREPGGTPAAEAIRELLLAGSVDRWRPLTETLLVLAARHEHVEQAIRPALAAGRFVLCDRFVDSTRVYQGIAGAVGLDLVDRLQQVAVGDLVPDLTLVLDLPVALGLARRRAGAGGNRFEGKGLAFHERVRAGFLELARAAPTRYQVVDAAAPEDQVAATVRRLVARRFALDLEDPEPMPPAP
jgi:dTMP kinase